jgi:hypothetical protein
MRVVLTFCQSVGERILPTAITERLCIGADRRPQRLTSGSTRPVAQTVTHAGSSRLIGTSSISLAMFRNDLQTRSVPFVQPGTGLLNPLQTI